MENLPVELYPNIFQFLDHQNLATALRVCKNWRKEASDDALWCKLFIQRCGEDLANTYSCRYSDSWKVHYAIKHRCDRHGLGLKVIKEGHDIYLIEHGDIRWCIGRWKGKMSKEEEQELCSNLSQRLLLFVDD